MGKGRKLLVIWTVLDLDWLDVDFELEQLWHKSTNSLQTRAQIEKDLASNL